MYKVCFRNFFHRLLKINGGNSFVVDCWFKGNLLDNIPRFEDIIKRSEKYYTVRSFNV